MFLHSLLLSVVDERDTALISPERKDSATTRTFLNSLLSDRYDDKKANKCVKQECGFSCISTRFHCTKPRGGAGAGIGSDGGRIRTARAEFTQRGDEKVIPADLLPHLSDHQKQGVALAKAAMDKHGAFLLADSTGVGKTRQQIAIAKMYADEGKRVLIVSKSSILQPDWNKKKMSGAFSTDGKEMKVGIRLASQRSDIRKGYVAATTYDRLDKIAGGVGKNTVLILDEAHGFKNRNSDRSRTGIKALERAEKVLYATATPIDKIDHLDYLGRLGVFGDRTGRQFRRFANSKDPDAIGLHSTIAERFDSLTKDGLMIRRELTLKGVDVGFTSVKIPKQAKDDMEKTASTYANNADRAQKLMTQRRQLEPYKIPAATREVNLALKEGRQAIVFVSRVNDSSTPSGVSTATAGALKNQLALAGITDVAELHGSSDIDRTEAAKRFQSGKAKVLITTLESGGTGINLDDVVGDKPRTIVMMTPPFSAVENVQAIGRVWRYNTKSMAQVKYLFSDTAVDQWNQSIIETKMRSLEANVKGEINALNIPTPRTDSLPRMSMNSFSLNSLLISREDGVGVPCGQSSMSKGETCHVGKGGAQQAGKMDESGAIAHLKKAGSAEDRHEVMELSTEVSTSELRSMLKQITSDIKAAESGIPPDDWGLFEDEVEKFKKDPWGSFDIFDDKKSAYNGKNNLELASDLGFRKFARSYFSKIEKMAEKEGDKEYKRFSSLAGGIVNGWAKNRSDGHPNYSGIWNSINYRLPTLMTSFNLDSLLVFRQDKNCKPTSLRCGDTCLSKARNPNGCRESGTKGVSKRKPSQPKNSNTADRLREIRENRETTKALSKSLLSKPENIYYQARVAAPIPNDPISANKKAIAESMISAGFRKQNKKIKAEYEQFTAKRNARVSALKSKAAKADPIALIAELQEMKGRKSDDYDENMANKDHVDVFQSELDKRIQEYRDSRK